MYQVILNPIAGNKKALKNLRVVERVLQENGKEFCVHFSQSVGDATKIAEELTKKGEQDLIVLGGDGTLHEVLNGIADPTNCRLGLVPSGTGNDFAERIGLPLDAEEAIKKIIHGIPKSTDYLEIGGIRCMNVAGLGMDVEVLERCKKGKLKGKVKYLLSLLQCLFAFKGCKVTIESEGKTEHHSVLLAATCNGTQFGGGIPVCPTAEVDDGKLDVVIVDCIGGVWKIIKAFIQLMKGEILTYPATTHFFCERARFIPDKPCTVQLDGELYSNLTFDVKVCSGLQFYR